jgi:glycosyltransferase involved in cell wall biosynthesis
VHTNTSEQLRGARFAGVIGRLMRWGYPGRPIVVPAQGVADDLRQNFGASDVKVIHHGIDAPAIQALAEQPITDLPTTRPYIVACGRLAAQKDYPTLLHAYASARSRGADEDLVIIGDGPDRAMLEHLTASLGLKQTVHFIGHRSNPFPYMKPARFFVLCSIWEGFGLVLLEAMSLGLPCISTDCPSGPAEILENGQRGLLVPTRDPASLAEALLNLSESQDLRESFAHQSRQRAQELGLGRMAQAYRDLFVGELNRDR